MRIENLNEAPTLSSGKVDYRRLRELAERMPVVVETGGDDFLSVLKRALRSEQIDLSKSFRDYGGDSLAYLEVELFLSNSGRDVPEGWERKPLKDLVAFERRDVPAEFQPSRIVPMDLLWRIAAICGIVANHSTQFHLSGGAYFLLVLSGYSLARFQSELLFRGDVLRACLKALGKVLLWYYLILILVHFSWKSVGIDWWLLIGNYDFSGNDRTKIGLYWYVSALTQVVLLACVPFLFPKIRAWAAEFPLAAGAIILICSSLAFEYAGVMEVHATVRLRHTIGAFQLAALGWCLYYANSQQSKVVLSFVVVAMLATYWRDASAIAIMFIAVGSIGILFGFRVYLKPFWASTVAYVASLTLFIYLFHPFVLAVVQRLGYKAQSENWSNTSMFVATLLGSIMCAAIAQFVTRKLDPFVSLFWKQVVFGEIALSKSRKQTFANSVI